MMTSDYNNKVGEVIRIEYDQETGELRVVIDITDPKFKKQVLHNKNFQDIITLKGKDAIVIATKK